MSERYPRTGVSGVVRPAANKRQHGIESLDSDILSASAIPSNPAHERNIDSEWVIFSPQIEEEELSSLCQQDIADICPNEVAPPEHASSDSHKRAIGDTNGGGGGTLELPTHNGLGSFSVAPYARRDLIERINAWRIEQSQYFFGDGELNHTSPFDSIVEPSSNDRHSTSRSVWSKIKESAKQCIDWDEVTIDALFAREFPKGINGPSGASAGKSHEIGVNVITDGSTELGGRFNDRAYLQRARQNGPPGWEQHLLGEQPSLQHTGFLVSLLARLFLGSFTQNLERNPSASMNSSMSSMCRSFSDGYEHSYHLHAIHNSISNLSSSMVGMPWSDTWDSASSITAAN